MIVKQEIRMAIPSNDEYTVDQMMKLLQELSAYLGRKITEDE
jgi:hypothetical protein